LSISAENLSQTDLLRELEPTAEASLD
jgi:hypothetical protein